MKTYACEWCSAETNKEEKGSHVLENGEMLCSECYSDPEVRRYITPQRTIKELTNPCAEIKIQEPVCPVINLQEFEDVLNALRINYGGHGIGITGNHRLMRLFIHMSECVINSRGANYK